MWPRINLSCRAGIELLNHTLGGTTIRTAGSVTASASGGLAIEAYQDEITSTADLIIEQTAGEILGDYKGIFTSNAATSATRITTAGTIRGRGGRGVHAYNLANATDIIINQTGGSITGSSRGIHTENQGTGKTIITTAGDITATSGYGIYAQHTTGSASTDMLIDQTAGQISSTISAIRAENYGNGNTSVTLSGGDILITGVNTAGVEIATAASKPGASAVTMQAGQIRTTGWRAKGINIDHRASGLATIDISGGTLGTEGEEGHGAMLQTEVADGHIAVGGSTTLSTIGNGAYGLFLVSGGSNLTIQADQSSGGITTTGENADGIMVFANNSAAMGITAIARQDGGSLTTTGGAITTSGVPTDGATGLTAHVAGTGLAQTIQSGGTLRTDGTMGYGMAGVNTGGGEVAVEQAGTITTSGELAHGLYAQADHGAASITAGGQISTSGQSAAGIFAIAAGASEIEQTSGTLTTTGLGQSAHQAAVLSSLGIAADMIDSGNADGILAYTTGNGQLTVTAGEIQAAGDGIDANAEAGDIVITATGAITAGEEGIDAVSRSVDIHIRQSAGDIDGGTSGIFASNIGSGTTSVVTAGRVAGATAAGLTVTGGPTAADIAVEQVAGSVGGGQQGMVISNTGTGTTTVTVAAEVSGAASDGIAIDNGGSSGPITLTQTAGIVSGATHGIDLTTLGAMGATVNVSAVIQGGGDQAIHLDTPADSLATITLGSGANVSASSGWAIADGDGDTTVTLESDATVTGHIVLADGNDTINLIGSAAVDPTARLDGGDTASTTTTDILGSGTAATNVLNLTGTSQSLTGSLLTNWQRVGLDGSSLTFVGDANLFTGSGTNPDGTPQGLVLANGSTLTSPLALAISGDVAIDATSSLNHALGGTISGNVASSGLIYWRNLGKTITIDGNYSGTAGSRLSLETYLAGDGSATDRLHVTGSTSGSSTIEIRPVAGSPGAQTTNGIQVVAVDSDSPAGSFTLASPVQAGAYEYVLAQGSILDANDWYLTSTYDCTIDNSCAPIDPIDPTDPTDPTGPTDPTDPTGPGSGIVLYRPGVANYVAAQTINREQGFGQISTYHQRFGGQFAADRQGRQTWLRPTYSYQKADGDDHFDYDAHLGGLQLGQELFVTPHEGSTDRLAITLDYSRAQADIADSLRSQAGLGDDTGDLNAHSYGLGAIWTRTWDQDGYIDLVGQFAWLKNEFTDSYHHDSTQKGLRGTLSVEAGRTVARWGDWGLELQGQLITMHTHYQGFNDHDSHIDGYDVDQVRGRIGARLYKSVHNALEKGTQLYLVTNLNHDFTSPEAVQIDNARVKERYSRTGAELGAGLTHRISDTISLSVDGRYQHSLDEPGAHNYQLNAGLKISF
ncbi:MAG: autotransporter outer membrane beta-barrel domain-containing protein [Desulfopila sp.]